LPEVAAMTAENFDRALQVFQQRTPFKIFTVELNTGQRFEIDSPFALIVRDGVAVFVAPGGIPILFDHESMNRIIGDSANAVA